MKNKRVKEAQIWSLLNNTKFKGYCIGFVVERFQKRDRNITSETIAEIVRKAIANLPKLGIESLDERNHSLYNIQIVVKTMQE